MKTQGDLDRTFEMPRSKVAAFFDEFPWLQDFLCPNKIGGKIKQVYVSGIETSIMSLKPEIAYLDDDLADDEMEYEKIWLIDKNKQIVTLKTWDIVYEKRFIYFGKSFSRNVDKTIDGLVKPRMTVQYAFHELCKRAADVCFILSYFDGAIIFYRPPKGMPVGEYVRLRVEMEKKDAKLELQKACEEIDSSFDVQMGYPEDFWAC